MVFVTEMILYFVEMSGVFVVKRQFENFSQVPLLSQQFRDVLVKCWVGGNTAEVLKENSFSSFFGYTHLKCSSQKFLTHLYNTEIEIQLRCKDFCSVPKKSNESFIMKPWLCVD